MSHHLPHRAPAAGLSGQAAARTSAATFHEREVRLVRESLWRRPQAGRGTKRGR
jgi:hypothetical protein